VERGASRATRPGIEGKTQGQSEEETEGSAGSGIRAIVTDEHPMQATRGPAPDPRFGAVLFHQRPRRGALGNAVFLLILGACMTLVVFAKAAPLSMRAGMFLFGCALAAFALLMAWRHWTHVFLQETGIREYRQGRGRSLGYEQVGEVTYSALRIFMHGSYIHTVEKLALRSARLPGPPLVCTHIFKERNPRNGAEMPTPVSDVRDAVSTSLAKRLSEQLVRENTLGWTPDLRIHAGGLEILDRKAGAQVVEWRRLTKIEIEQGKLRIWVDSDAHPRVDTSTAVPNFYPIYFLMMQCRK
jgi:hypothetical protein